MCILYVVFGVVDVGALDVGEHRLLSPSLTHTHTIVCLASLKTHSTHSTHQVRAQPQNVLNQLRTALGMLATSRVSNGEQQQQQQQHTKVRFGRNVEIVPKIQQDKEKKKKINYKIQTRDAIRSVLLRKLLKQKKRERHRRIDPKTGDILMTAKEWKTKFGREIRSTQMYDQQMSRKNQLHSEILKRVKLRHPPAWTTIEKSGRLEYYNEENKSNSRRPEFFMPPVLS